MLNIERLTIELDYMASNRGAPVFDGAFHLKDGTKVPLTDAQSKAIIAGIQDVAKVALREHAAAMLQQAEGQAA